MSSERDNALIDELLGLSAETPWIEFKKNNTDPASIGRYISALSNSARSNDIECAYLVWGIEDPTHDVVGTSFNPELERVGNQPLEHWLATRLKPDIVFTFRTINHSNGRLVLLEIPAPTSAPIQFENIAYIRIGSTTPKLVDFPARYELLLEKLRPYSWEQGIAKQFVHSEEILSLLDFAQYFRLIDTPVPDGRSRILEHLEAERFIKRDVGGRWNILNLGAILFATNLNNFTPAISRKGVRFVRYSGNDRASTVIGRQDGKKGYACGFEGLLSYITGLLPKNEHIEGALRREHPLFPEIAVRELIANALIHQDMTIRGAGPQIELFENRMEITNPGNPLMSTDRMIDLPPRSRNETLAALMRRMGMCEEQGSGLDKVVLNVELFQLPPPLFKEHDTSMQVILYGPRTFANMTQDERVRACYQHAVLRFLSGDKMKNSSLCERFGIDKKNAAQASAVIAKALDAGFIKPMDPEHPRSGYVPSWA